MKFALVDPRMGRIAHGCEQIHGVVAQRNKSGFEFWSDENVKLVDRGVSFGHETVDALAYVSRLIGITEDALADAGKEYESNFTLGVP